MTYPPKVREMLMLALGCECDSSDADFTLSCALEILRFEAEVICAAEDAPASAMRSLCMAHANRIAALEKIFDSLMVARWKEEQFEPVETAEAAE